MEYLFSCVNVSNYASMSQIIKHIGFHGNYSAVLYTMSMACILFTKTDQSFCIHVKKYTGDAVSDDISCMEGTSSMGFVLSCMSLRCS